MRGLRIKGFFEDYDRKRKGFVPASKFASAITMSGLTLSEGEMQVLADAYRHPEDETLVNYMPFVFELDGGTASAQPGE